MPPIVVLAVAEQSLAEHLANAAAAAGLETRLEADADRVGDAVEGVRPSVLAVGPWLRGGSALEALRTVRVRHLHVPVIQIVPEGDVGTAVQAVKAGAFEVLVLPLREQDFLDAVWAALRHGERCRPVVHEVRQWRERLARLTERECEILERVASGSANKRIAADLGISQKTVEAHRSRILAKMECDTIAGLMSRYAMSRLVADPDLAVVARAGPS